MRRVGFCEYRQANFDERGSWRGVDGTRTPGHRSAVMSVQNEVLGRSPLATVPLILGRRLERVPACGGVTAEPERRLMAVHTSVDASGTRQAGHALDQGGPGTGFTRHELFGDRRCRGGGFGPKHHRVANRHGFDAGRGEQRGRIDWICVEVERTPTLGSQLRSSSVPASQLRDYAFSAQEFICAVAQPICAS
jgi:hypothetical protein